MRSHHLLLAVFVVFFFLQAAFAKPLELTISVHGNDQAAGDKAYPLASLCAARDRLRALNAQGKIPADGAIVDIQPGSYRLTEPLTLGSQDDFGGKPVVYRAMPGGDVCLLGSQALSSWLNVSDQSILSRFKPEARSNVLVTYLPSDGVTNYGELSNKGFFAEPKNPLPLELFYNDRPMTLARWPNDGAWATVADVPANTKDRFAYTGDEPSKWQQTGDIWVHGYFGFDWADSYNRIDSIDTVSHTIVTADPQPPFGFVKDHRWYAENILEELDTPGEYYLDRKTGNLYFWMPKQSQAHPDTPQLPSVSVIDSFVNAHGVSNVRFEGLVFDQCRGTAITMDGGSGDSIVDCTIRNSGGSGVDISGANQAVVGCHIEDVGETGIVLTGGDRKTLTPSSNRVTDCVIDRYARICRTYHPGVQINGVGNIVAHNHIFDAPHEAIALSGNDNRIQFNEIDHVCRETGDAGAFYMGRDWTFQGNLVNGNYFHDIGGATGLVGYHDTMAVYLDDMTCGTIVTSNLFVNASHAIQVGGGRDNLVVNNIFVNCSPAYSLDSRGLTWAAKSIASGGDWNMQDRLAAVPYNQPPYTTQYPNLATMPTDNPGQPKGDIFERNIVFDCPNWLSIDTAAQSGLVQSNNLIDTDPQFVDPAKGDYQLKPSSPAFALGFKQLPLNEIGPRPQGQR